MEQKDYSLEIVALLLKESNHIRGLAKKLGVNHMIILRNLKKLMEKNVVDFVQKGKNNNYFIRKSAEARVYVFMAEQYKLVQFLERHPYMRDIIEKMQKNSKIKLALVFGSYSKGTYKKDSDIDIFIETNSRKIKKDYSLLDSKLSIKIGKLGDNELSREITKNYVLIKGEEIYHEKFFG